MMRDILEKKKLRSTCTAFLTDLDWAKTELKYLQDSCPNCGDESQGPDNNDHMETDGDETKGPDDEDEPKGPDSDEPRGPDNKDEPLGPDGDGPRGPDGKNLPKDLDGDEPRGPGDKDEPKGPDDEDEPKVPDDEETRGPDDEHEPKGPDDEETRGPDDEDEPKRPDSDEPPRRPDNKDEPMGPDGDDPKVPDDEDEPKGPDDEDEPKGPDDEETRGPDDEDEPKEPDDEDEPKGPDDEETRGPDDEDEPKGPDDEDEPKGPDDEETRGPDDEDEPKGPDDEDEPMGPDDEETRGPDDEDEPKGPDDEDEPKGPDDEETRGPDDEDEPKGPDSDEPRGPDNKDEPMGPDDEETRGPDDEDEPKVPDDEDEPKGPDDEETRGPEDEDEPKVPDDEDEPKGPDDEETRGPDDEDEPKGPDDEDELKGPDSEEPRGPYNKDEPMGTDGDGPRGPDCKNVPKDLDGDEPRGPGDKDEPMGPDGDEPKVPDGKNVPKDLDGDEPKVPDDQDEPMGPDGDGPRGPDGKNVPKDLDGDEPKGPDDEDEPKGPDGDEPRSPDDIDKPKGYFSDQPNESGGFDEPKRPDCKLGNPDLSYVTDDNEVSYVSSRMDTEEIRTDTKVTQIIIGDYAVEFDDFTINYDKATVEGFLKENWETSEAVFEQPFEEVTITTDNNMQGAVAVDAQMMAPKPSTSYVLRSRSEHALQPGQLYGMVHEKEEEGDDTDIDSDYEQTSDPDSTESSDNNEEETRKSKKSKIAPKKLKFHETSDSSDDEGLIKTIKIKSATKISDDELNTDRIPPSNDSDLSETVPEFPALNVITSSRDDDTSDEDPPSDIPNDVVRDKHFPDIYITKVSSSETTRTGKQKKNSRVFNSYQYCHFCQKKVSNFSQHILDSKLKGHKNLREVQQILKTENKKERRRLLGLLRSKFNHFHNMKVMAAKSGQIILERRPSANFDVSQYGPCPRCFSWISLKLMWKHQISCNSKPTEMVSSSALLTQSNVLTARIPKETSQMMRNEVFQYMQSDEVGNAARGDELIIRLGNMWLDKNCGNKLKRGKYTSQIMRLCAKLLLNLKKFAPEKAKTMWDILKPENFEILVQAAILTALPFMDDVTELKAPSNAVKLGYEIKRLLNIKIGVSIEKGLKNDREQAEDLMKLMQIFWGTRVSKNARCILNDRQFNKQEALPDPEDIKKLNVYLKQHLEELDLSKPTPDLYATVVELVEAKLTLYNRRRTGEIEGAQKKNYALRAKGTDNHQIIGDCSEFEKHLLETQEVMEIRGKTGRGVPVIIPDEVTPALSFICDDAVRTSVGISLDNPYIFAKSGKGRHMVVRAYDSLRKMCQSAELNAPERITSTNLRKYMATFTQVLDLKGHQMEWVINHLGHTLNVHKTHYRNTSADIERVHVAKLLLIQDLGLQSKFQNMQLEHIQLEDIMLSSSPDHDQNETNEATNKDFLNMATSDMQPCFEEPSTKVFRIAADLEDDEAEQKNSKKFVPAQNRVKWQAAEEREIKMYFASYLKKREKPSTTEIRTQMKKSEKGGGLIHKRSLSALKNKIFRMLSAKVVK